MIIKIEEGHFGAKLSLVTACDRVEFFELLKELKIELDNKNDEHNDTDGFAITENGYSIIWVNPELGKAQYLEFLVHELLHYCTGTLIRVGVPVNYKNEEMLAYFQQKMLRRCLKKLKFFEK